MSLLKEYNKYSKYMVDAWQPAQSVSNEDKLKLYGLYKQINEGNCICEQPWPWNVEETAKYNAWRLNFNMTKNAAMMKYIDVAKQLIEKYSHK